MMMMMNLSHTHTPLDSLVRECVVLVTDVLEEMCWIHNSIYKENLGDSGCACLTYFGIVSGRRTDGSWAMQLESRSDCRNLYGYDSTLSPIVS